MRNMFNIKKIIFFQIIMQKIILSRTREGGISNINQYKSNKFFDNQFNRNHEFDKIRHFNKFEKNDKSNNYFNAQTNNKHTNAKIKNKETIVILNIINSKSLIEIVQKRIDKAR